MDRATVVGMWVQLFERQLFHSFCRDEAGAWYIRVWEKGGGHTDLRTVAECVAYFEKERTE